MMIGGNNGEPEHSDQYYMQMINEYLEYLQPDGEVSEVSMEAYGQDEENGPYNPEHWKEFLRSDWEFKLKIFRLVIPNVVIEGLSVKGLKDLQSTLVGQPIELEPLRVVSVSNTEAHPEWNRFYCKSCGTELAKPVNRQNVSKKERIAASTCCDKQKLIQLDIDVSKDCVDAQWLRLEEPHRNGGRITKTPLTIQGCLKGEAMMWKVKFNEYVSPIGMLRYWTIKDKNGRQRTSKWFEIYGVKKTKDVERDIELTDHDIQYIKKEMLEEDFFKKLLASFAPHIQGMELLKECALLTLASVGLSKPVRILVVGDPSVGKSEIMEYASNLLPHSYYVVMSNARKTGLTVTSQKDPDTDTWMVEPGIFAAADGSAVWIDEFQQGDEKDIVGLNHVVERGKISYALAGGNYGEFDANCALMISTNAHAGMIGSEENIHELLKFVGKGLPAFLTRMSLVIFIRDKKNPDEDRAIVEKIYENSGNDILARYEEDWHDQKQMEENEIEIVPGLSAVFNMSAKRFGTKTIRKIIKYVTEHVTISELPEELRDDFVDYYMGKRQNVADRANKLISPRYMRHMQVLTDAFARLQGRSVVKREDMTHVFGLLEQHMTLAATDPKTGEVDENILNGNQPKSKIERMAKQEQFEEAMKKAMIDDDGNNKGYFTINDITYHCTMMSNSRWKSDTEVENEVQKRLNYGKLMEKHGQGKYTPV